MATENAETQPTTTSIPRETSVTASEIPAQKTCSSAVAGRKAAPEAGSGEKENR